MIVPARGKILCEIISRERLLPSGIWLTDKIRHEKKDNICRCLGVGDPAISPKGKPIPMEVRRTDIVHYKENFGKKLTYEGKKLIVLKPEEVIAVERDGKVVAVGSMVIAKLKHDEKIGTFYVPDNVKQNSGNYHGEVVIVGPEYPDKSLKKGDKIVYLRNEGYRFRTMDRVEYIAIKENWIYGKGDL